MKPEELKWLGDVPSPAVLYILLPVTINNQNYIIRESYMRFFENKLTYCRWSYFLRDNQLEFFAFKMG